MKTLDLLVIIKGETEQLDEAVINIGENSFHDPNRGYARHTIKKLRADLLTLDKRLKEFKE